MCFVPESPLKPEAAAELEPSFGPQLMDPSLAWTGRRRSASGGGRLQDRPSPLNPVLARQARLLLGRASSESGSTPRRVRGSSGATDRRLANGPWRFAQPHCWQIEVPANETPARGSTTSRVFPRNATDVWLSQSPYLRWGVKRLQHEPAISDERCHCRHDQAVGQGGKVLVGQIKRADQQ